MSFAALVLIFIVAFLGFLWFFIFFYQIINQFDQVTEIKVRELVLIFIILLLTGLISSFVVHKQKVITYFVYTCLRLLYYILAKVALPKVATAGLFAGFMTTAELGYLYYLFVVPRFVFDNYEDSFGFEHYQKRVASMSSFVIGQFIMFASVYYPTLHKRLVQPDFIFLLFMVFFTTQVVWVRLTIVRNLRFLYPRDKRRKVVRRIVLLQGEFMLNFFLQLALLPSNSYIEGTSKTRALVNTYLRNRFVGYQTKKLFRQTSFVGWLIGHILFMIRYIKIFQWMVLITIWVKNWFKTDFKSDK